MEREKDKEGDALLPVILLQAHKWLGAASTSVQIRIYIYTILHAYDFMHDLHASKIGVQFFIRIQLQNSV